MLVSFDLTYRAALRSEEEAGMPTGASCQRSTWCLPGTRKQPLLWAEQGPQGVGAPDRRAGPASGHHQVGDAFVAGSGYIAELLKGLDPHQRLETAVRTGAIACMVPGDWEGMPRRHELGMLEKSEPVAR